MPSNTGSKYDEYDTLLSDMLAQHFVAKGYTFDEALATAPDGIQTDPEAVAIFRTSWERAGGK